MGKKFGLSLAENLLANRAKPVGRAGAVALVESATGGAICASLTLAWAPRAKASDHFIYRMKTFGEATLKLPAAMLLPVRVLHYFFIDDKRQTMF
jgi:hypothetical protein